MVKRHRSAAMKIELIQQNRFPLLTQAAPPSSPQPAPPPSPPPLLTSPPNPSRHLVRIRRRLVSFFGSAYISVDDILSPVRNFIYRRCPLLNLLLVSEHDKRISSVPLHSSYIVLASQISHMRFSRGGGGGEKLLNRHKRIPPGSGAEVR